MGRSSYKRLGDYIQPVDIRNKDNAVENLLGLSMTKQFRPSTSNIVGVDLSKYKVVDKHVFAFDTMSVIRTGKVPIAINLTDDPIIVSPAYVTFESIDVDLLDPLYLMMWFSRSEFDRFAFFKSDASVRGGYKWDELCDTLINLPSINKQRKIVAQYETITRRIALNERICANLEETAQALYNKMFVQDIDPDDLPDGWRMGTLDEIAKIVMGQSPDGRTYNELGEGVIFFQGRTDFGFRFPSIRMYTTQPTRMASENDILISVRAPVGDLNVSLYKCCIGRGLASIRSKESNTSFLLYTLKYYEGYFGSLNDDGTIFGSINKETLSGMPIVIPTETLVKEFETTAKAIDSKIKNAILTNRVLDNVKGLLLSNL